ncbi:MAG: cadherin repeat domain-containing protein [Candidatus Woesearchaeota archaeon]
MNLNRIKSAVGIAILIVGLVLFLRSRLEKTGMAVSEVNVENAPPTPPRLVYPENNSLIFEDSEISYYLWNNSIDYNLDKITYQLHVGLDNNFSFLAFETEDIPEGDKQTNYSNLSITYSKGDYFWRVRGFDNESYGDWSQWFRFRYCVGNQPPVLEPLGSITMFQYDFFRTIVKATDPDGDNITFSDNTELFEINSTTGEISTRLKSVGTFLITIVAFDGCNATHDIFVLNVIPRNFTMPNITNEGPEKPGEEKSGGGGGMPPPPPEEKKNITNQTPVRELTPEERRLFTKAEIIYIGNFAEQDEFNVTMYKGPIWFFTYEGTNYFLTLTPIKGDMIYIGFFGGPGFLFNKYSTAPADINSNGAPDILIKYNNRTDGNYSITLDAVKKPKKQAPSRIIKLLQSTTLKILFLILLSISILFLLGKETMKYISRRKEPLLIKRNVSLEKIGLYKVELIIRNVGSAPVYNIEVHEPGALGGSIEGEIKIEKEPAAEVENSIENEEIVLKVKELSPRKEIAIIYNLRRKNRLLFKQGFASYQLKILETFVDFVRRY